MVNKRLWIYGSHIYELRLKTWIWKRPFSTAPVSQRSLIQIPYRPSFHYYLSNVHYCEDRFHIHVFNNSSNIWLSYIHNRLKDNKLGRCHNLVTEMGEFSRQAVIFRARWSCYLHILFTSRIWQNSDVEALCLWKNFCSWKKQKQKKDLGIKRGKKKKALRRKISNKVASNQNLSYIEQNEVSFYLYKYQPWHMNFNNCLEMLFWKPSVDSFSCFSAHFEVFPFLPRVFPMALATLPIIVSSSSTLYRTIAMKKRVRQGSLFPGNLDPSLLTPGGPVVPLVCGFGRRDNLRAWCELFTNLYELKSANDEIMSNE